MIQSRAQLVGRIVLPMTREVVESLDRLHLADSAASRVEHRVSMALSALGCSVEEREAPVVPLAAL